MIPRTVTLTLEPSEEEIQHAAYFLWEAEGKPVGRDLEIWLAARERLRHRLPPRRPRTRRASIGVTITRNAQPGRGPIR